MSRAPNNEAPLARVVLLLSLLPVCLALVAGCWSDDDPLPDASVDAGGEPDKGSDPDEGADPDAADPDAADPDAADPDAADPDAADPDGAADAGGDGPPPGCSATDDLAPFVLDPAYCVKERFAVEATALRLRGDTLWTFRSTGAKAYAVQTLDLGAGGAAATPKTFFDITVGETGTFGGLFLALSSTAKEVAVGYNTADFANPEGSVLWGAEAQAPAEIAANGNYYADFLDDETLLVNGKGAGALEGQSLYLLERGKAPRRLISKLGDQSGLVIVSGAAVHVGAFFCGNAACDTGTNRLFGFSLAEVKAAVAAQVKLTTDGDGDEVYTGGLFSAAAEGDDLLLATYDSASFAFTGVGRLPLTVAGDKVSAGAKADLVTVPAGATGRVEALTADGGLIGAMVTDQAGASTMALIKKIGQ